jgi:hypothetical protein
MLIYNITTMVEPAIEEAWLTWMRGVQIPAFMASGDFLSYQLVRLLDIGEGQGPTFALQLYADDRAACDHFAEAFAPALELESRRLWGDRSLAFGTWMEVMH